MKRLRSGERPGTNRFPQGETASSGYTENTTTLRSEHFVKKHNHRKHVRVLRLVFSLRNIHRFHIFVDRLNNHVSLIFGLLPIIISSFPYHQLVLRQAVLFILDITPPAMTHILTSLRSEFVMVGIRGSILVGLPHHHEAHKQDVVVHGPHTVVHPTFTAAPRTYSHWYFHIVPLSS